MAGNESRKNWGQIMKGFSTGEGPPREIMGLGKSHDKLSVQKEP